MAVIWEDDFHDTSKMRAPLSTYKKRIKQWTTEGLLQADEVADFCTMNLVGLINAFFNDQDLATNAVMTSTDTDAVYEDKVMRIADSGSADSSIMERNTKDGADYVGGWREAELSIYLYYDTDWLAITADVLLMAYFKDGSDDPLSGDVKYAAVGISTDVSTTQFVAAEHDGSLRVTGISLPSRSGWVKLVIAKLEDIISYRIKTLEAGEQEALQRILTKNSDLGASMFVQIDGNTSPITTDWDYAEVKTHIEQKVQGSTWYDHQHEFWTELISPANWYQWDKINLTKISQSLPNRKFVTFTVYDNADAVIDDLEDMTEDELDISAITEDKIYLKIKFWSEDSYESPMLEKLEVSYFTTGGEVTLAVTANTYNDDITTPITTKTGYRITFDATPATPADTDLEVTHYWFDFGDGLNTGWITNNVVNHVYNKHSQTIGEAGADLEWNARVKVKFTDKKSEITSVSGWSNYIDFNVLNSNPVARLWASPIIVRMSGAGPSASVSLFGDDSYDVDDNGSIATSGGYKFDLGEGDPEVWQNESYITNVYTVAGTYVVGLTVKDDLTAESSKITTRVKILPELVATLLVFDRIPRQADIDFDADLQITKTIAGGYPDVEPTTALNKSLKIIGQGHMKEDDITLMQGYLENGILVQFNYNDLDGVTQSFTGYIRSLRTGRRGGFKDDVPWSATIQYKAV